MNSTKNNLKNNEIINKNISLLKIFNIKTLIVLFFLRKKTYFPSIHLLIQLINILI